MTSARRARNAANAARRRPTYTHWDELMASKVDPTPEDKRRHQLTRMWQGLRALEQDAAPTPDDWRVVSDAVNLLETMVVDMRVAEDASGLLPDAVRLFPACAGMNLTLRRHGHQPQPVPRVRGDEPHQCSRHVPQTSCSPRARG